MTALQQLLTTHDSLKDHALVLARPSDISYFTGFEFLTPLDQERDAYLVVTPQTAHLLYASFSPFTQLPWLRSSTGASPQALCQVVEQLTTEEHLSHVSIDEQSLFIHEYRALQSLANITLRPLDRTTIWQLRMHKDAAEIEALRAACRATSQVVNATSKALREGMTELDVRDMVESGLRQAGCTGLSFPSIVCFGPHAALPHHQPTTTALQPNTAVLIDVGGSVNGYRADMTRTVWFGPQPSETFVRVEKAVLEAYQAALEVASARGRKTAKDIDTAARSSIGNHGYGEQFIHTTGHGVGLDIHEPPSLSWRNEQPIEPGMTITIEPGIYLVDQFGYRYENTLLVTDAGCESLTQEQPS